MQKGTGKWTVQSSAEYGVPVTLIAEALFARCLSAQKPQRVAASEILQPPPAPNRHLDKQRTLDDIRKANSLWFGIVMYSSLLYHHCSLYCFDLLTRCRRCTRRSSCRTLRAFS